MLVCHRGMASDVMRMQRAYDAAKDFALMLPTLSLEESLMPDIKSRIKKEGEEPKTEESYSGQCVATIDFSREIAPCKKQDKRFLTKDSIEETRPKSSNKILVFVSLSMPEESLKQLARDALTHNAVLILRGLQNNSFKETLDVLQAMSHPKEHGSFHGFEGGFEINPMLFETYNITHVPVFIHLKQGQEQSRLSGNVPLSFAYKKLMDAYEKVKT